MRVIFFLPVPICLLRIFSKFFDRIVSDKIPVDNYDLLKQNIYKNMIIHLDNRDGTKVRIKTI